MTTQELNELAIALLKAEGKAPTTPNIRKKVSELKAMSVEEQNALATEQGIDVVEEQPVVVTTGGFDDVSDLVPNDSKNFQVKVISAINSKSFAPIIEGVVNKQKMRFVGRAIDTLDKGITNNSLLTGCTVTIKTGFVPSRNSSPGNETYHCHIVSIDTPTPQAERMIENYFLQEGREIARLRNRKRFLSTSGVMNVADESEVF